MTKDPNQDANKGPQGQGHEKPAKGGQQGQQQGQSKGPRPDKGGGQKGGGGGGGGGKKKEAEVVDTGPKEPARLRVLFHEKVRPGLTEKFGIKNINAMPRLEKVVLNVNMGRHIEGTKIPPTVRTQVLDTLTKITGQRPVVIKAKKSVANFKVREGLETAAMVTVRRDRMWHFLDRLINLATPRIKDFRGLPVTAFDKQGNYSMGLTEQGVFPEINMAEAEFTHGMHINVVFTKSSPALSRFVLEQLGMPFAKPEDKPVRPKIERPKQQQPEARPQAKPAAAPVPAKPAPGAKPAAPAGKAPAEKKK